jgi:protein TonB
MDRTIILGAAFSAALHAGLLFGPDRGAVPASVDKPKDKASPFELRLMTDPPEPVAVDDYSDSAKGPKENLVPTGIDNSTPDPTGFTIDVPRVPPVDVTGIKHLGPVVIGVPHGTGEIPKGMPIDLSRLDNTPRTRSQIPPVYPADARRAGITGKVMVEFVVDEEGRVHDPRVMNSSDRVFEEPSLRAISRWRFEPGRKDGRIVRFRMAVPVDFNLNE